MSEHTPLPWEVGDLDRNGQRIVTSEHIEICTCWHHSVGAIEKQMEANAELIVKAVNAYEPLVEALTALEAKASTLLGQCCYVGDDQFEIQDSDNAVGELETAVSETQDVLEVLKDIGEDMP